MVIILINKLSLCIAPAYCLCKNLLVVNLSSNNVSCLFKVLLYPSRISISCFVLWSVDWLVEHGQGKWVRLSSCFIKSPFLYIFLRNGICRLFFCFSCCSCFFALLKYAVCSSVDSLQSYLGNSEFSFFYFLFFQEALLSALSCVCVNCR